ncbi:hypothetical protein R3W88_025748 [Solanum pinnatisectum]|uniref:F-box domain-containing protein n=1 Tax=Solanum pinnatisectum TaxID=50273 RepID=A0AAV9M3Z1_9SOLN|nr:hypothetical protein R3W88_025748 [Solanum pinnatisectum]
MAVDSVPVLPPELISEILARLPVKTLLKIRSVSKSMLSLISDPQFIKTHLKFSINNQQFTYHKFVFRNFDDENRLSYYTCSLFPIPICEKPQRIPTELDFSCEDSFGDRYRILGSCDGLICISRDILDLFLWNPTTRKVKKLPSSGINVSREHDVDFSYGFGCCTDTDQCRIDYRVVEIVRKEHSCINRYYVSVYSLRSNSWKRIEEYPSIVFWDYSGKFVNGKLHWSAEDRVSHSESTFFISSFDLANETFGNVALPGPDGEFFDREVGCSGGNLCLFCYFENKTDVWVMKEYDVAESWTKIASIPTKDYKAWPIFIFRDDEILVHESRSLVWFNSRDNTFMLLRLGYVVMLQTILVYSMKVLFLHIFWRNLSINE